MSWFTIDFSNSNISEINAQIDTAPEILKKELSSIQENIRKNLAEVFTTSGTTGIKTSFDFSQEQIKCSVGQTLNLFDLQSGDSIVSPLDNSFVAGKMNLYRSIYGRLKLHWIDPKLFKTNLSELPASNFITLVPNQFMHLLEDTKAMSKCKTILLGGGTIPTNEIEQKAPKNVVIYHGFGMTETLTHFAIRQMAPSFEELYYPVGAFTIDVDDNLLQINHPIICPKGIQTSEIVSIKSNGFQWLGRASNMIKSGGIKFFPEIIESKIVHLFHGNIAIVGLPHPQFGEAITLFVEDDSDYQSLEAIKNLLSNQLTPFEIPKGIVLATSFPRTNSEKIQRKELQKKYQSHYENID